MQNGLVHAVSVDMGQAVLTPEKIPVRLEGDKAVNVPVEIDGQPYHITCVSMGNPHCIVFVDDVDHFPLEQLGPKFENDPLFPERVNTEFVKVVNNKTLQMRVWERGSGETMACGTGACAAVVAMSASGRCGRKAGVHLLGGELFIEWEVASGHVFMTGPAVSVFDGELSD